MEGLSFRKRNEALAASRRVTMSVCLVVLMLAILSVYYATVFGARVRARSMGEALETPEDQFRSQDQEDSSLSEESNFVNRGVDVGPERTNLAETGKESEDQNVNPMRTAGAADDLESTTAGEDPSSALDAGKETHLGDAAGRGGSQPSEIKEDGSILEEVTNLPEKPNSPVSGPILSGDSAAGEEGEGEEQGTGSGEEKLGGSLKMNEEQAEDGVKGEGDSGVSKLSEASELEGKEEGSGEAGEEEVGGKEQVEGDGGVEDAAEGKTGASSTTADRRAGAKDDGVEEEASGSASQEEEAGDSEGELTDRAAGSKAVDPKSGGESADVDATELEPESESEGPAKKGGAEKDAGDDEVAPEEDLSPLRGSAWRAAMAGEEEPGEEQSPVEESGAGSKAAAGGAGAAGESSGGNDAEDDVAGADKKTISVTSKGVPICGSQYSDIIPCLDHKMQKKMKLKLKTALMEHYERHCPTSDLRMKCLIPPPEGYKIPIEWPQSRDEVWKANVPHTFLAQEKSDQNWMVVEGDRIRFPGGGTHFSTGADKYIKQIAEMLGSEDGDISLGGKIRTVLDVGCGVASFGAFMLPRILTVSLAPNDVHQNQIQFALERGIPAQLAVLGTQRLPYPSKSFELAHCSRCRIDWAQRDGILLLEIDRLLRPGGYWVWSAPPVYRTQDEEEQKIWSEVSDLTSRMCWKVVAKESQTVIFQKPRNNACYLRRPAGTLPPICNATLQDADAAWYSPMRPCLNLVPKRKSSKWRPLVPWPARLLAPTARLQFLKTSAAAFEADTLAWKARVKAYWAALSAHLPGKSFRNIMDMNAGFGGFAAALIRKPVWVMNVVAASDRHRLKVVYDRGLIGTLHDWCESFSTYPRTYDMLHAFQVVSGTQRRQCDVDDLLIEIDRVLRPGGVAVFRDKPRAVKLVRRKLEALRWRELAPVSEAPADRISDKPESILYVQKSLWAAADVGLEDAEGAEDEDALEERGSGKRRGEGGAVGGASSAGDDDKADQAQGDDSESGEGGGGPEEEEEEEPKKQVVVKRAAKKESRRTGRARRTGPARKKKAVPAKKAAAEEEEVEEPAGAAEAAENDGAAGRGAKNEEGELDLEREPEQEEAQSGEPDLAEGKTEAARGGEEEEAVE